MDIVIVIRRSSVILRDRDVVSVRTGFGAAQGSNLALAKAVSIISEPESTVEYAETQPANASLPYRLISA